MSRTVGLVVNPVAGMGGSVGLHGTDGAERLAEARRRGATPVVFGRVARLLARLDLRDAALLVGSGPLGQDEARAAGLATEVVGPGVPGETTAHDTRRVAQALCERGCDVVLFAGGDGTARDVVAAVGSEQTVLGVPSGVKMRSGVFAASPEAAADIVTELLTSGSARLVKADVVDVGDDGVSPILHGVATVLAGTRGHLVGPKASSTAGGGAALDALASALAKELRGGVLYLVGPGTTAGAVLSELGLEASALGVDAVFNRHLVGRDLSELQVWRLLEAHPDSELILGVIGGQGFLLGRGNQQLSARVLHRVGASRITVVAAERKLLDLDPAELRLDLDGDVEGLFGNFCRVRVGPRRYLALPVVRPNRN